MRELLKAIDCLKMKLTHKNDILDEIFEDIGLFKDQYFSEIGEGGRNKIQEILDKLENI